MRAPHSSQGGGRMTSLPYIKFFVGDHLASTAHFTTEEQGAYLLILFAMWQQDDCSLPNDQTMLARIARADARRWKEIGPNVMAKLAVEGDRVTQRRLREEHQNAIALSGKRKRSGREGGRSKALRNKEAAIANANDLPTYARASPQPQPQPCGAKAPHKGASGEAEIEMDDEIPF
jgi:uncharacterized protein YdaU (DUF1376 family)